MKTTTKENTVKITDATSNDVMDIGSLWAALAHFTMNRHKDNGLYDGEYPIEIRMMQMKTLKCLVSEIENFHNKLSKCP